MRERLFTVGVMCCCKTVGTVVGCVAGTVVEGDVVNVDTGAVCDGEAMDGIVFNVNVVD